MITSQANSTVVAPVTLFQSQNYKLCLSLGLTPRCLIPVRAVLDTGAGPNLVRDDVLPPGWERMLIPGQILPRVSNASGRRMPVNGVVQLVVRVGDLVRRVRFLVTRDLAVPCILGCHFINAHVKGIIPRDRRVDLCEGGSVSLLGRYDGCSTSSATLAISRVSNKVRVAKMAVIPPRSEANIYVTCALAGLCLITGPDSRRMSPISLARGVAEVHPQTPFRVRVINPSTRKVCIPRNMVIGYAEAQPEQILTLDESSLTGPARPPVSPVVSKPVIATPWEDQVDLDHLTPLDREKVLQTLRPHREMWDGRLGNVSATSHRIDVVPGSRPVHAQPYRAGGRAREAEQEEIKKMLAQGVIEPAMSEWASPVVLVPKSDGSLRFCVDYRRLNAITVPDTYPLPRMDECIDSLGDAAIFTTLDCNSGYWQIPVHPPDRDKTTFTSHHGTYRFRRLPFGLRNAPATFQRAIDVILSGVKWKTCLVYLDDVIIFSPDRESHLGHVDEALSLLRQAGLSLKLKKCRFFSETVDYLGHVIRPGRLGVAEKNTDALRTAAPPRTQTELRSFLGLCNVYRRFVPKFSTIAAPLNSCLTKGKPAILGMLSTEALAAFETLREKLLNPPILALPRRSGHLWLDTDASNSQLGCCLLQEQPSGPPLPLGYWSRTLNAAERNYSTTEKECLAIVWAVTHLRPYLEGVEFTVRTDHHALRWVMNLAEAQGRLARWRLRLAEFNFKVEYSPGATHHAADVLSRLPSPGVPDVPIDVDIPVTLVHLDDPSRPLALEPNSADSIEEIEVLHTADLFHLHCRDHLSLRHAARVAEDPAWDYDPNGLLVQRRPDGEVEIYLPHALRSRGPYAIIHPIRPLAEDGSDLSGGVLPEFSPTFAPEFSASAPRGVPTAPDFPPGRPRILWNRSSSRQTCLSDTPGQGLAILAVPESDSTRISDTIPKGHEVNEGAVTIEEFRIAQAGDESCSRLLSLNSPSSNYDLDRRGLLVRVAPSDGTQQVVVPRTLVRRILHNEHYPPSAGHPGAHRMFLSLRRAYFWPRMAADVYETVNNCDACARNRISEKAKTNPLKLFPAKGPLESVAMDILGPLPRTKHGNRFLLVITDRYSKVTKTVPLRVVTALSAARAFLDHWVYAYGAPLSLLTDNGPQFTSKFFQAVCAELGVKKVFTTAYHPQTNGQVERYNRTILSALRGYVARRQDDWDEYTSTLTYAYNCRVHSTLGMPPFELALTRPPTTTSLHDLPRDEELDPKTEKQALLERLKTLRLRADGKLSKSQARYKAGYDRGVTTKKNAQLREGDQAYVRVEVTEVGRSHKLDSLVHGPYRIVENDGHTFRLQVGSDVIRVSSDRVTPAPPASAITPARETAPPDVPMQTPSSGDSRMERTPPKGKETDVGNGDGGIASAIPPPDRPSRKTVRWAPDVGNHTRTREEYAIERLVDIGYGEDGVPLYRVRWVGYSPEEDTWESSQHLPPHFVRRFEKAKRRKLRGALLIERLSRAGVGPCF
jgi:transposase InsO family protein